MSKSVIYKGTIIITPIRMLTWLLITQIMVAFVGRSLAPLGVLIGEDLNLSNAQIGMLPAALFLGQSLASIPAGFFVDRVGSKKLLLLLSLCLGLSFMVMSITSIYSIVLLMVILGGIGYATMHPTSNKGIIHWFPEKRGTMMGIKQMGVTLGSALAALLLLPLAILWGWRPVLFGACLLLITTGILAYKSYFDTVDKGVNNLSINEPTRLIPSIIQMIKHKSLVLVSVAAMGLSGGQIIFNTYLVLFAYEYIGMSLFLSGMLLVISEISGSFGRVAWGMISDNLFHGNRIIVLIIIAVLSILASISLTFFSEGTSFWIMTPFTIIFGFCISGFNGIWMNATTELVPIEQVGIASGFSLTVASWGVIIGPPLFGYIVDTTGMFSFGWLFLSTIMIVVIILLVLATLIENRKEISGNKRVI